MINKSAIAAIKLYKKYLSKHKGYTCAYGSAQGKSCSTIAIELITSNGLFKAIPLMKRQIERCRDASILEKPRRRHTDGKCFDGIPGSLLEDKKPNNDNLCCDANPVASCFFKCPCSWKKR